MPLTPASRPTADQSGSPITLRAPHDIVAVVPFLLGFHPEESVVALLLERGRLRLTARYELPQRGAVGDLAEEIRALARQHRADELVLVGYSESNASEPVLESLVPALRRLRVRVALAVSDGRCAVLGRYGFEAIPAPVPDLRSHPVAAAAVYAGLNARATRAELQAWVSGPAAAEWTRLEEVAAVACQRHAEGSEAAVEGAAKGAPEGGAEARLARLLSTGVDSPNALDEAALVELAVLVADVHRRDRAWLAITTDRAQQHIRLWHAVVAAAPPPHQAAPLALLGIAAWIAGDGALLNVCAERLRAEAPAYSMGSLLERVSEAALSPSHWTPWRESLLAETGEHSLLVGGPALH